MSTVSWTSYLAILSLALSLHGLVVLLIGIALEAIVEHDGGEGVTHHVVMRSPGESARRVSAQFLAEVAQMDFLCLVETFMVFLELLVRAAMFYRYLKSLLA